MNTTWIVVADHQRARLFELETPQESLREFSDMVHPESRVHEADLTRNDPGTTRNRVGQGVYGMRSRHSPHEQESIRFAKEVVQRLEQGRNAHEFERLVIAAEPKFLGLLRNAMPSELRDMVTNEISKELTHLRKAEDIRRHLPERLYKKPLV